MNRFRISPDNPVRRRLFEFDDAEQAAIDNFANLLQEEDTRAKKENMEKWNFDFENEIPLEGNIEWVPCDGPLLYTGRVKTDMNNEIITSQQERDEEEDVDEESKRMIDNTDEEFYEEDGLLLQKRNETTPDKKKCSEDEEEAALHKMERRRGVTTDCMNGNHRNDRTIRRNIQFE